MVKVYQSVFNLNYPWDMVAGAFFQKYPNPFSSHVLSADTIERFVDPKTGKLHTIRLLLKTGSMPKWGRALLNASESYVIEYSVVDPGTREMVSITRNLNHTKFMVFEETQRVTERPSSNATVLNSEARVVSNISWRMLRSKAELVGLNRFREGIEKSVKGLTHVIEKLRQYRSGGAHISHSLNSSIK